MSNEIKNPAEICPPDEIDEAQGHRNVVARFNRVDEDVLEEAMDAVFAVIAKAFPEITSGNMGPGDTYDLEVSIRSTMITWIGNNIALSDDEIEAFYAKAVR